MTISGLSNKFRKFITAVLIVAMFIATTGSFSCVALAADEPQSVVEGGPDIKAKAAVVMDINTGAVLFAKNPTERHQPSSLTKLLTCYVALENLSLTDTISISPEAAKLTFPTAAEIGYTTNEIITVHDAIKGSLLCSAEDCTFALAERTAATQDRFAELMNQASINLGFRNSHFKNALGKYEEEHYSCAYDMALIASILMKNNSSYASILSSKNVRLGATSNRNSQIITSTHRFMNETAKCDHVYAAKTGGSAYGGNKTWALCTYAKYKNINAVCIIMDGPTNDSTYSDTKKIFDYIWDSYDDISSSLLVNSSAKEAGAMFNELSMFDITNKSNIYLAKDALTSLPLHYNPDLISSDVTFNQISDYSYGENIIGEVSFYYDGVFSGTSDIVFYTESASMTAAEFSKLFPSYLKVPDPGTMNYMTGIATKEHKSLSFWGKIKAGVLSFYTPAKTISFVISLVLFVIGGLIILLAFPTHKKINEDNLYSPLYDNIPNNEYEGETGNLRRMRTSRDIDMQEIGVTSSYSDNRKKRNRR